MIDALIVEGGAPNVMYIVAADQSEAYTLHGLWLTLSDEEALTLRGVFIFGNIAEARKHHAGRLDRKIFETRMREVQ